MLFARRGCKVTILERMPQPDSWVVDPRRMIPLILLPAVQEPLKKLGIQIPEDGWQNGVRHLSGLYSLKADKKVQGRPMSNALQAERTAFAQHLLKEAKRKFPGVVDLQTSSTVEAIDLDGQNVTYRTGDEVTSRSLPYDLLVGADGIESVVRASIAVTNPRLVSKVTKARGDYAHFLVPSIGKPGDDSSELVRQGEFVSVRYTKPAKGANFGPHLLLFYRNSEGIIAGTVGGTLGCLEAISGREDEWLEAVVPEVFPSSWVKPVAAGMHGPASNTADIVELSSIAAPRVVLLGDAAHPITPGIGLGCTSALVDANELDKAMEQCSGDLKRVHEVYNSIRFKEVRALTEFEKWVQKEAQLDLADRLWKVVFVANGIVHQLGHKVLPALVPLPPVALAVRGVTSFQAAKRRMVVESAIFLAVVAIALLKLLLVQ
ncbi:unnamed protein product [Ostreobium quekettii]|uniref:FAD-binding domain-containing protein n=1 Tax=Ostreobium quekettii TaxID=121088 RepID=A0A8S1IKZ5_9CHLO|nr:unnamed protein product [Ostreobium quekettii]